MGGTTTTTEGEEGQGESQKWVGQRKILYRPEKGGK